MEGGINYRDADDIMTILEKDCKGMNRSRLQSFEAVVGDAGWRGRPWRRVR